MITFPKTIYLAFVFLLSFPLFSQEKGSVRDTLRDENGVIRSIIDYDAGTYARNGIYKLFDSLGNKTEEGICRPSDSIGCLGCYDISLSPGDDSIRSYSSYPKAKYADYLRDGIWTFYHSNGKVKMKGCYSEKVHERTGISYPLSWEGKSWPTPMPGYGTYEFLKNGVWEYYDETGGHYLTEVYMDGQLVHKVERTD